MKSIFKKITQLLTISYFLFSFSAIADISTYTLQSQGTLPNLNEASGVTVCDTGSQIGECYVDNGSGEVHFPGGYCTYGGDPEGITHRLPGQVSLLNEKVGGVVTIHLNSSDTEGGPCTWSDRYQLIGVPIGSQGMEGIESDGVYIWVMSQSGDVYRYIETNQDVTPTFMFSINNCTNCGSIGFLHNGNFVVCSGPEAGNNGEAIEIDKNTYQEVSRLPLHQANCEGITEINGELIAVGEPNHRDVYTGNQTQDEIVPCETSIVTVNYNVTQDRIDEPATVPLTGAQCEGYEGVIQ